MSSYFLAMPYEYKYALFAPVTKRYIQFRQLHDDTNDGYGCVVNLRVETSVSAFPGLEKSMLLLAYTKVPPCSKP
jgi:hypothetical protein